MSCKRTKGGIKCENSLRREKYDVPSAFKGKTKVFAMMG